ncbi:MAG: hypothetical protein QM811_03510 [Pirellulales bacterium]
MAWKNDYQVIDWADAVKLNKFKIGGPLNVPDHSTYDYTAVNGAAQGRGKWLEQENGDDAAIITNSDAGIDKMRRTWGEGAETGLLVYQADDDFVWQVEVNVVKIALGSENQILYNQQGDGPVPGTNNIIASASPNLAMQNRIVVTLEGPVRGGVQRGIDFIEVGIMQTAIVSTGNWRSTNNTRTLISGFEGRTFLDQITDGAGSERPWYDSRDTTSVPGRQGVRKVGEPLGPGNSIQLSTGDRPFLPIWPNAVTTPTTSVMVIDFRLYVAARTADGTHPAVNTNATTTYVRQASRRLAIRWQRDICSERRRRVDLELYTSSARDGR